MKTMNDVFDRYVLECLPKLAPATQRQTLGHLRILRAAFGERVPADIKPRDVGRFLDVPTAKQHRNKIVATLSAVFTLAVGRWFVDDCDSNPCFRVERHESHPRTRYITDAEFWAVHAIAIHSVQVAMELALLLGQRQGDIIGLKWSKVDETLITIAQQKTGKHLGIKLTQAVYEVLAKARQRNPWQLPNVYVIRTKTGERYTPGGFREAWQLTINRALELGVVKRRYTFHDIRAKCASDMRNLAQASKLLGHEEEGMTQRVYIRNMVIVEPLR